MTALEHLLQVLNTHAGSVSILERTLRQRDGDMLNARRPDLAFAKQVAHWAAAQRLICLHKPNLKQFTFTRIDTP